MAGACAFVFIAYLYTKLAKFDTDMGENDPGKIKAPNRKRLDDLSKTIKTGAIEFLKTEYKYLSFFVAALAATLFGLFAQTDNSKVAFAISLSFVFGASLSAAAGWWGMPAG